MIERLALPPWDGNPTELEVWTSKFAELGHPATVSDKTSNSAWIEVTSMRLRGFAVLEQGLVEAINFEIHHPNPAAAITLLESVTKSLGWELHQDDDDYDEEDD